MSAELAPSKYRMLRPIKELPHKLLGWYDVARREMPWRETKEPYRIWLSETMLQQTQVETVKPYYCRFLERFPTVLTLAQADLQEVLSLWAGLGYYRRAKHLHLAAQQVVKDCGGQFPRTPEGLRELPGVGRYTAAAVASIAFDFPAVVVDGNVMRVLSRLTGYEKDVAEAKNTEFFWELGERIHQEMQGAGTRRHGDLNQALMELGATVCTPLPSRPRCGECPVRAFCRAAAEGRQMELPVKGKKGETPVVRGVAVVLWRSKNQEARSKKDGEVEVLLGQRAMGGLWEAMWEFPVVGEGNIKHKTPNTKRAATAARVMLKALEIPAKSVRQAGSVIHQLTHRRFELEVVVVEVTTKTPSHQERGTTGKKMNMMNGYMAMRWVKWPGGEGLPMARIVGRVAEAAGMGRSE